MNTDWLTTTLIAAVTGVLGFLSNTFFKQKELDQKGFDLLSRAFQDQFNRMDAEITELRKEVRATSVLLSQAEAKIRELTKTNFELREKIAVLQDRLDEARQNQHRKTQQ